MRIWYRYEFQGKTGALPRIHAVIQTGEDNQSMEVKQGIICQEYRLRGELYKLREQGKIRQTPGSSVLYDESIEESVRLFKQIQNHDCAQGKFRCRKKTDLLQKPVCRIPKYRSSNDFGYKVIPLIRFLSIKASKSWSWQTRRKLLTDQFLTNVFQEANFLCPTDYTDQFPPTNLLLFHYIRSSRDSQICDKDLSARYTTKNAAGVDTRADVRVKTGSDEYSVSVETDDIQNGKIAGVKASLKNRKTAEPNLASGRHVSVTELVWWSFNFPYVVTNVVFVHV